jgi:O-antigen/teichoic acid export membrane protein
MKKLNINLVAIIIFAILTLIGLIGAISTVWETRFIGDVEYGYYNMRLIIFGLFLLLGSLGLTIVVIVDYNFKLRK